MRIHHSLSLAALGILLASCAKEPVMVAPVEEDDRIPLNIEGSISQVATRATAAGFVDQDAVGLFAVNYTENNTLAGTLAAEGNQADNVKYVFDEANYKWTPMKPVYYKDINTNVDLYVYYPYQNSVKDVNTFGFEVQKDQSSEASATVKSGYEASDWLWGMAENITPSESRVRIPLKHRLSAVQVTLAEGTGFEEGEYAILSKTILLTNTTRKATLDFTTGTATPLGEPQLDGIIMCPQEDGTFRAIVIPQTIDAGIQLFAITVNGISYSFSQPENVTYQAGKQLSVTINIKKKTPTGDFELELAESQIVDWTEDRTSHGGEARQYFVVNVETPGTLGSVIESMEKNPAKIRNLKVTGTINADDFYFMRDQMTILEAVNLKECTPVLTYSIEAYSDWGDYESKWVASYGEPTYVDESGTYRRWDFENKVMIPNDAFHGKSSLYFVSLPDNIVEIGSNAFSGTNFSGALSIPSSVRIIGDGAFSNCKLISSLSLPQSLISIGGSAFAGCNGISGTLTFPPMVQYIGGWAFNGCSGLNGPLILPDNLNSLEPGVFKDCSGFTGSVRIPDGITAINIGSDEPPFYGCSGLQGSLDLNNVTELTTTNWPMFTDWGTKVFTGELKLPEGLVELPDRKLSINCSTVVFPSTLKKIGIESFCEAPLIGEVIIPEGVLQIGDGAFRGCQFITSIVLPSTLIQIGRSAFEGCYGLGKIICHAAEVPNTLSGAFNGVPKDNFNVEVPESAVSKYRADNVWGDFKRISAHYDFALSRDFMRTLNQETSRTYTLRAPAGHSWSVQEKPDWVIVEPSSGVGKTDVTITVSPMAASDVESFEVNEGTFNNPSYNTYSGRGGEIIFCLDEKDYTFSMAIEQYDSEYPDGSVLTLQTASAGSGIDIVFTGDGYDARDIAKGTLRSNAEEAYGHLFALEPYKTYKDYFNVYVVTAQSDESGIGTLNTIIDNKFGSAFTQNRILLEQQDEVFTWAKKADTGMDLTKSLVILLQNTSAYEGITYMYGDGSAIACCPVSRQAYPYDFRGIVQHEAGGHGFGKLADEYIYHNAFIQTCDCKDGCDHGYVFNLMKAHGWYKNLSFSGDATQVPWGHLIYHPQYSNTVDIFEGGYMHTRGVYRSEVTSCMNNNIPYYSAISRQAIVERIMECSGETFSLEDFYSRDDDSFGPATKAGIRPLQDRTFGVDPHLNHSTGHGPVFMGNHPNVK